MKSIICEKTEAAGRAAEQVRELISGCPKAVLALAGGRSTGELYKKLVQMYEKNEISFKEVSVFLVADFDEAPEGMSFAEILNEDFLSKTDIKPENCHFISKNNFKDYDDDIAAAGGIDLIILGIGANTHIGFNEPACPFNCVSHRQRITDATKRQYAQRFGGEDKVPGIGYTMGIKTIYEARHFMLLAFGEDKAEPIFNMFYGRNDSRYPAAFLQLPSDVSCYMDAAAAAKL